MSGHEESEPEIKPLYWVGSSREDLIEFPLRVRKQTGYALYLAQIGLRSQTAKSLRGFGGAGVLKIVENHDGSTYRAVYTLNFPRAVFVLHAFKKKSARGIETPKHIVDLIKQRLRTAEEHYLEMFPEEEE